MTFEEWWKELTGNIPCSVANPAILAELAWNAAIENQWQPIETAPRDRPILTISKNAANRWTIPSVLVWWMGNGWKVSGFPEDRMVYHSPLYWMPLPQPPKEEPMP